MEWWTELGNTLMFMPDTPALALDMTTGGSIDSRMNYSLAYSLQSTPVDLETYPSRGMEFPEGV